jgi:hemoglobin
MNPPDARPLNQHSQPGDRPPSSEPGASSSPPTLFEWVGGLPALTRLTDVFYSRVPADPLLGPVFAQMSPDHPRHVALFLAEVLGGPTDYSTELGGERGGHARMLAHHLGRRLTEAQRARWMTLLLACADEIGMPSDPEFRSALVAYLEWGTRLAVINSNDPTVEATPQPMPKWGWGVPGGPYRPTP